jgi:hypothetical protein
MIRKRNTAQASNDEDEEVDHQLPTTSSEIDEKRGSVVHLIRRHQRRGRILFAVAVAVCVLLFSCISYCSLLKTTIASLLPQSSQLASYQNGIDLVSLTVSHDFFILFDQSAITSWLMHIQNIRSITFIGPPADYSLFAMNMKLYYPHLNFVSNDVPLDSLPKLPIRWVNETYWKEKYQSRYDCPYASACQQLIKLHSFELRTHLGLHDLSDNILILDSDTVWSRKVAFVENGRVTYFEVYNGTDVECNGMDPIQFTETITIGEDTSAEALFNSLLSQNLSVEEIRLTMEKAARSQKKKRTVTPYKACRRSEHPEASGARHIAHHMLFQYDVITHLHKTINKAWKTSSVWEASRKCYQHYSCKSRIAEYELYYSFLNEHYPERIHLETLKNTVNFMSGSAICDADEMHCCEEKRVLLKACHDHRVTQWKTNRTDFGDMCCERGIVAGLDLS